MVVIKLGFLVFVLELKIIALKERFDNLRGAVGEGRGRVMYRVFLGYKICFFS